MDLIKSFANPPDKVVLAMRPVYHMITKTVAKKDKPVEWSTIRGFMANNFIKQVVELKADDIPKEVKESVLK